MAGLDSFMVVSLLKVTAKVITPWAVFRKNFRGDDDAERVLKSSKSEIYQAFLSSMLQRFAVVVDKLYKFEDP